MDIVERLRQSWNLPDAETCAKAADEIAACRKERDEWRHIAEQNAETIRQMMERSDEP